jgi:toxin HigB-1
MGISAYDYQHMIISFGNKLAKDLVEENSSKELRSFPNELVRSARKKLLMVYTAKELKDLLVPPGNRLEKLKGDRKEYHSIRINDQWRVVFRFLNGNAHDVKVEDYHS